MTVVRVGVSLDDGLLSRFDELIASQGYDNRSEAIRDLIRKSLIDRTIQMPNERVIGTLTIVYDHHVGDVTERLLEIQHDHHEAIQSTTHVHMDHDNCLEVLIVKGRSKDVKTLADSIRAVRGVKHGELTVTTGHH